MSFRGIAAVIGSRPGLPAASREAGHSGWFAHVAAMDCPGSAARTREALGWPDYFGG